MYNSACRDMSFFEVLCVAFGVAVWAFLTDNVCVK